MDRDKRWDRTKLAYDALTVGVALTKLLMQRLQFLKPTAEERLTSLLNRL